MKLSTAQIKALEMLAAAASEKHFCRQVFAADSRGIRSATVRILRDKGLLEVVNAQTETLPWYSNAKARTTYTIKATQAGIDAIA